MSLTPADKFEISELLAKFCYYSDYCDYEALAGVFAENPTITMEGWGTFSGLDYQIQHSRESARMTNGKNRHAITNLWIEPDGEGAVARYFFLNINAGSNPTEAIIVTTLRQIDKLVRTKKGWRIKDRTSIFDQVLPPMTGGSMLPEEQK